MDDATRKFLLPKNTRTLPLPYTIDKAKVLDLTKRLLDKSLTGSIQDAFEKYIDECMAHIVYIESEELPKHVPTQRIEEDKLLLPQTKSLDYFVKRKKN